jgi:hypothetical protein
METSAFLLLVVGVIVRRWRRAACFNIRLLDVARRIEEEFPQLHDSLASAVEFLDQSEDDLYAGSAQLRRLVVAQVQQEIDSLPLQQVIDKRPMRRATIGLGAVLAIAGLCLLLNPGAATTALTRLVAPLGNNQWPRLHYLEFLNLPAKIAAGEPLQIEVIDANGEPPDDARLECSIVGEVGTQVSVEPLVRDGNVLVAHKDNVRHSFGVRAVGGDDHAMPWHWVEVVEPPRLESFEAIVHPPPYSGLPVQAATPHLQALAGSGIELRGVTSHAIRKALLLPDGSEPINAAVTADAKGSVSRVFHVAPQQWLATKSGPYRIELTDDSGVATEVGRWNLQVEPDPPPTVAWEMSGESLFVLPEAVIPIRVRVRDNLAIQRVELSYDRSDRAESERSNHPTEPKIELYQGPKKPTLTVDGGSATHQPIAANGENRTIDFAWDLTPLQLPAGAKLTVQAEAQDYRPGLGRAAAPLVISIISADALESRLAEQQKQICRQLEQTLAIQQAAREAVERLLIELRDAGALTKDGRTTLQSTEPNQRRVARMLVDPGEGVVRLAKSIVDEVAMNRLTNSPIRATMDRLLNELGRLMPHLTAADRGLTAARKAVELTAPFKDGLQTVQQPSTPDQKSAEVTTQSLAASAAAQAEVIAALERLLADLSGKADYRQLVQQLSALKQEQIDHEKSARQEIGVETLPLNIGELSKIQRAKLNEAAAGEEAIAGRFAKIDHSLEDLQHQLLDANDLIAGRVEDALELARQLAISQDMHQSAGDLRDNRVNQALERELSIADKLRKVLDTLRHDSESKPEQVVQDLRSAESRLDSLRKKVGDLQRRAAVAERNAAPPKEQQNLAAQQKSIQQDAEKLANQLERQRAPEAARLTQDAAHKLSNNNAQRPSTSAQIKQAEQSLRQAASQLSQRRQEAEENLELEFVRRFQTELAEMVERQRRVLTRTGELDTAHQGAPSFSADEQVRIAALAEEEQRLAGLAKEHSEVLFGLGPVRIGLEEAERRLQAAGLFLKAQQVGESAQTAERLALARLEDMLAAFAQTADQAPPKANPTPPNAGGGNNNPPPPRRPTFELLQAKMLRMLQADLNARTQQLEARLAHAWPAEKAALLHEAQDLTIEQGRLADLVRSMLQRDNEQRQAEP